MFRTKDDKSHLFNQPLRARQKVEFPTLRHFVDDILDVGIHTVRLDLFEDVKQTELSFVYYITLTLYLTALDIAGYTLYEYTEPVGTTASSDIKLQDDSFLEVAQSRVREVEQQLSEANLTVRHGRFAMANNNPLM